MHLPQSGCGNAPLRTGQQARLGSWRARGTTRALCCDVDVAPGPRCTSVCAHARTHKGAATRTPLRSLPSPCCSLTPVLVPAHPSVRLPVRCSPFPLLTCCALFTSPPLICVLICVLTFTHLHPSVCLPVCLSVCFCPPVCFRLVIRFCPSAFRPSVHLPICPSACFRLVI
jgi:hypothetical protein